jgi:ferredoxin
VRQTGSLVCGTCALRVGFGRLMEHSGSRLAYAGARNGRSEGRYRQLERCSRSNPVRWLAETGAPWDRFRSDPRGPSEACRHRRCGEQTLQRSASSTGAAIVRQTGSLVCGTCALRVGFGRLTERSGSRLARAGARNGRSEGWHPGGAGTPTLEPRFGQTTQAPSNFGRRKCATLSLLSVAKE